MPCLTPSFLLLARAVAAPLPVPVADAGPDRMAYVGDTVVLQGAGSGSDLLTYGWTQVAGPPVELQFADTPNPKFVVQEAATYAFQLTVSDGTATSEADIVFVPAVRPDAGQPVGEAAGCATAPGGAGAALALAALMGSARRRRHRP